MGDRIDNLPTDDTTQSSKSDIEMMSTLFKNKEQVSKVTNELKDTIIAAVLFTILSIKCVDKIIKSTGIQSDIYVFGIKLVIFMFLFYILKNRF